MFIRRPCLDKKEIKITTISDVPEDIKMRIETELGVTLAEHKEWFWCFIFSYVFVRNRTNVITLTFIRCCHAIIVLLIFENVFYLKKHFIVCYFPFEISVLKYCSLF